MGIFLYGSIIIFLAGLFGVLILSLFALYFQLEREMMEEENKYWAHLGYRSTKSIIPDVLEYADQHPEIDYVIERQLERCFVIYPAFDQYYEFDLPPICLN